MVFIGDTNNVIKYFDDILVSAEKWWQTMLTKYKNDHINAEHIYTLYVYSDMS